jgi:hypothetical protein
MWIGQGGSMTSTPVSDSRWSWFKRTGWFYRPATLAGVFATLLPLAFCVNVFLAVDRHSHSATDTLYGVYPFFTSSFLLWSWVADRTSEK